MKRRLAPQVCRFLIAVQALHIGMAYAQPPEANWRAVQFGLAADARFVFCSPPMCASRSKKTLLEQRLLAALPASMPVTLVEPAVPLHSVVPQSTPTPFKPQDPARSRKVSPRKRSPALKCPDKAN